MYENSIKWGNVYVNSKSTLSRKSVFEIGRLYDAFSHEIKDNSRVLDIGCGKGVVANFFLNNSKCEYYGFDINSKLVRHSAKDYGPHFFVGNGLQLPIKDNSFDAIIFNAVLHHILDIEAILKESVRVLRPHGIIFIQEPNLYSLQILVLGVDAPLKIWGELLDPNERPLNPRYIQYCLKKLQLNTRCAGVNMFPVKLLNIFPSSISNFINRLDLIIISIFSIFHLPLITMNFRIVGKKL